MPTPHTPHAPNAALLIDFDNVTLGIRSDLTKELRTLLNSDIIKGKVAVQRAYADWRRYPQYIVSLSESSIDLIFAPAFGTAKKNATDIRLAVDAIELVFTRPEIGTFILLSGDSDFSSMVLKLKEYGKYVIGVGIRESASDLLIQNCDEYYSYSDLAGLSKESDQPTEPLDPWQLVVTAVNKMVENRDVMRSDRLKQVMQQIDPNFDERGVGPGYNRFSKFVSEAAHRGLIEVTKQENGQFEVAPKQGEKREERSEKREERGEQVAAPGTASEGSGRRRGRGRGRGRGRSSEEVAAKPESGPAPHPGVALAAKMADLTLAEAFQLMSRALGELPTPVGDETLRGRMAALHGLEDPLLAAPRFAKLLRQANDAEVADVRQLDGDRFEVSQHKTDLAFHQKRSTAEQTTPGGEVTDTSKPVMPRFRGSGRSPGQRSAPPMVGLIEFTASGTPVMVEPPRAEPAAKAEVVEKKAPEVVAAAPTEPPAAKKGRGRRKKSAPKQSKPQATAAVAPAPSKPAAAKKTQPGGKAPAASKAARSKG